MQVITRQPGTLQGLTLLLPVTMAVMGIVVLLPVLPALLTQFHAVPHAATLVGIMLTIPAVLVVLFAGVAGYLADVIGRKALLLGAMLVYGLAGMAPFVMDSFWPIFATRCLVGVCEAAVLVITTTLIGDYFRGAEREKWLAYQIGVAAIAATALILVGGALGAHFGWRGPFLIYGLALPLALMVALFIWEPAPDTSLGEHAGNATWRDFPWRRMGGICALTIFAAFLFYLVQYEFSLALALHGVTDPGRGGMLLGVVSAGTTAGALLFRAVSKRTVATLLCAELAITGIGLVAMWFAASATSLTVFATISQIGSGMILPTLLTWAVRGLSFEHRGRGTGIWQGVFTLGQFVVAASMPAVNVLTGSLPKSLGLIGIMTLVAAAGAFVVMLRQRDAVHIVAV